MKWIRLISMSWMLALAANSQSLQSVNLGTAINDGSGDPIRTALQKLNNNDSNLWNQAFVVQVATNALVARRKVVNSFAELLTVDPNTTDQVEMLGYYGPGRGGYSIYTITNTIAGTNECGGRVLALGGAKAWQINASNGQINSRQFGAVPGTNGAAGPIIDKLFDYCAANLLTAVIGGGDHYLTNTVYLRTNLAIDGEPRAALVWNSTAPIDTRFAMLSVLGDLWPNNYLDTNVTTFDIVATNISIKNIELRAASTNNVGFPLAISNARYVTVDGVKIGLCGYAWGITFMAEDIVIRNCTIDTTGGGLAKTIYTDGIHGIGAKRFLIKDNHIVTGDDCIALSSLGTIGFTDGLIQNNTVKSYRGHGIRMQQDRPYSYAVWTNITWRGMNGEAGIDSNGGILIQNLSTNSYNPFRNLTIADVKLRVGNLSTQGGGTNYSGGNRALYIDCAENLLLSNIDLTRTAFETYDVERSTGVVMENCYGEGSEWWFRNATVRFDRVTNAVVRGGYFQTLTTSIVSNSAPVAIIGSENVRVEGSTLVGSNTNKGGIQLEGSQSGHVAIFNNTLINPSGYGVFSIINPQSILVVGNKVTAATPAAWQGSAPPALSAIANNIGLSSLGRLEATGFDLMNSSSGIYAGGVDLRGNYETRMRNISGMFMFSQDEVNGGSKAIRLGAQPSNSANKPNAFMVSSDTGTFPTMSINGGSASVNGHRWVYMEAAPSDYVASTKIGLWNNNGMLLKELAASSPTADSYFEVSHTTKGSRPIPDMTDAQWGAIVPSRGGLMGYITDRKTPMVSTGLSTNSHRQILTFISSLADADVTLLANLAVGTTHTLATPTANRTVTLPSLGVRAGDVIRFTRPVTGNFTWAIGSAITLPALTKCWAEVQYDGSAWVAISYGTIP